MVDLPGMSSSADPDEDDVEDSGGSPINLKKVALICAGLAGVALLGSGVVYGPAVWRVTQQRDTKVATPAEIGSLLMDTSDDATNTAEYLRDAIATKVNLDKSVAAIYRDKDGPTAARTVFLIAGTGRVWKPANSLEDAFSAVADDSGGVSAVQDVDAGPLGGIMRCGVTTTQDGGAQDSELAVCGWADNGSVGVALFSGRPAAEAATSMLQLRDAVEHRG